MNRHIENNKPEFCKICKKPNKGYGVRGNGSGKWYYYLTCTTCKGRLDMAAKRKRMAKMRVEEPERYYRLRRHEQLRSVFRIGIEDYEKMLADQGGVCAICGTSDSGKFTFAVDHNHKTNRIRGILCHWCNKGLGQFYDNPKNLRRAADYLDGSLYST